MEVSLTGRLYKQDNFTVHKIILRNIDDASDAFTYVKPYIKNDDGRTDTKALRSRYENVAMQEKCVSEAKRTIETIQYRNKRAMTFDKFVRKLVKAVDELGKRGRGMLKLYLEGSEILAQCSVADPLPDDLNNSRV